MTLMYANRGKEMWSSFSKPHATVEKVTTHVKYDWNGLYKGMFFNNNHTMNVTIQAFSSNQQGNFRQGNGYFNSIHQDETLKSLI